MNTFIDRLALFALGLALGSLIGGLMLTSPVEVDAGHCEYSPSFGMEYAQCTGKATPEGKGWVSRGFLPPDARFYARYREHGQQP